MNKKNVNQQSVEEFMRQIPSQAKTLAPRPQIPDMNTRLLRARLMFEETLETIKGLGVAVTFGELDISFKRVGFKICPTTVPDIVEVADGLADMEVVLLGTAAACGINHQPVFEEVMRNNMLKLERGTIDAGGKLIKPPNHPKPDIATVLQRQAGGLICCCNGGCGGHSGICTDPGILTTLGPYAAHVCTECVTAIAKRFLGLDS